MANGFVQYLRDTQAELRHVAWPTRFQTIIYSVLVALLSVGVALYLGLFDFVFTSGLARLISVLPHNPPTSAAQVETGTNTIQITPAASSSSQQ